MRIYLLFPLAFLSGIYGFIIFAPYLIAVVAVGHLMRRRRRPALASVVPAVTQTPAFAGFAPAA